MRNKKSKKIYIQNDLNSLFSKTVLDSGLTVVSEQSPDSPYFALGFCIKSGSANDKQGYEGTAHFMEHIAFRRTLHYTGRRLVTEFESIGAYVNAYTTKEMTCFYVLALNAKLKKCLKLLSEIVLYPEIKTKDIDKEKNIILEEISSYEDDPEELIFDLGEQILFRASSYEHPIVGYTETVKNIEREDFIDFHRENYVPNNTILSYSGPQNHFAILEMAEQLNFVHLDTNKEIIPNVPKANRAKKSISKKNFQQSHLLFTTRTKGLNSDGRYIYAIINNLLGEGLSSRLNQVLREKYGYVYSVYSTLALLRDVGTMSIYAASDLKNIFKVEELVINEFEKIVNNGFTEREIKSAKEQIKSSTIIALDGVSSKMQSLARTEAVSGEYESISDTINLIDSVQNEDIQKAVKKHLAPKKWSEVILQAEG